MPANNRNNRNNSKRPMKVIKDFDEQNHKSLSRLLDMEPELTKLIKDKRAEFASRRLFKNIITFMLAIAVLLFVLVTSGNEIINLVYNNDEVPLK